MKAVIEFGVCGGRHCDNVVLPSLKLAARLAQEISAMLGHKGDLSDWLLTKAKPRISWKSDSHFVSVTMLDGVDRGAASGTLWPIGE